MSLGSVFVEIMGDADPFADDFAEALDEAGEVASDELTGSMDDVTDDVSDLLGEAGEAGGEALVEGLDDAAGDVADDLPDALGDAGEEAGEALVDGVEDAAGDMADVLDDAGTAGGDALVDGIEDAADDVADLLGGAGEEGGDALVDGIDGAADEVPDLLGEAGDAGGDALVDGIDGAADEVAAALADAGEEGGDALTSGVEDAMADLDVDIDVDAAGAFDDVVAEAEGAADDTAGAFDGVTDSIQAAFDDIDLSGLASSMEDNVGTITAATGGAALAGEGLARTMQDTEFALTRVGRMTGEGSEGMRDLALDLQNATFPMDEVTRLMELAAQRGLEGRDAIGDYATFWDMVGDATGESSGALAEAGVALGLVGIEAGNEAEALAAFGFIADETSGTVEGFLGFVERTALEMGDAAPTVDEMAGALGALEDTGLRGQRAQRELRQALSETDGDMIAALETLGVTEDAFNEQVDAVEGSSGAIEANAAAYADLRTPGQKLEAMVESLGTRFGGFGGIISAATAPLAAVGPAIFGVSQVAPLAGKALGAVGGAFKALGVTLLANPIFLIAAVLIGIIAVIWIFRDEIMAALGSAWSWVRETTGALLDWFSGAWAGLREAVVGFVSRMVESVVGWFTGLRDRAAAVVDGLIETVVGAVTGWVSDVVGLVTGLWEAWTSLVSGIRDAVVDTVADLVATVVGAVTGWVSAVVGLVGRLRDRFVSTVVRLREAVIGAVAGLVRRAAALVAGMVRTLIGNVQSLRRDFLGTIARMIGNVLSLFRAMPGRILRAIGNLARLLVNKGRSVVTGLWSGISQMGSWLAGKITGWVADVIPGPIARALGIGSPSQVAADLAREVPRGLVVGIEAELAGLERAAERAARAALPELDVPTVEFDVRAPVAAARRDAAAVPSVPAGGRAAPLIGELHMHTADPRKAGRAVVRELRDVAYLKGDMPEPGGDVP